MEGFKFTILIKELIRTTTYYNYNCCFIMLLFVFQTLHLRPRAEVVSDDVLGVVPAPQKSPSPATIVVWSREIEETMPVSFKKRRNYQENVLIFLMLLLQSDSRKPKLHGPQWIICV